MRAVDWLGPFKGSAVSCLGAFWDQPPTDPPLTYPLVSFSRQVAVELAECRRFALRPGHNGPPWKWALGRAGPSGCPLSGSAQSRALDFLPELGESCRPVIIATP